MSPWIQPTVQVPKILSEGTFLQSLVFNSICGKFLMFLFIWTVREFENMFPLW